ncbi:MAG: Chromosome (plasmid) partitioning protein ParB [uncultured Thermomicrobiales bacterium]|uniref:Chromosome (Plasmid) partitioning protein ParB n=1 Tax=uncultured Thermomicrobiales bacterium TaxID=1645740 RepID=A0A6J4V3F6_9BACT|nr:MAG: Chromosome (plasmid) partitioning protein ParB [uncultured Thermomicrobiales bacterium]
MSERSPERADTTPGTSHSSASRGRRRFTVDSLFSDTRAQAAGVADLPDARIIDLDRIEGDPLQPRRTFDPDRLDELAASIAAEGVLQPIVVRFDAERNRYIVVHGERRVRAARIAGLGAIPALIRDVPEDHRLVQQLMENVVRDDLNAVDRAAALRALRGQLGDPPWEVVAARVGIKRSRLFQLLGTEKLSEGTREDIQGGRLSEKQSRALQGLPPAKQDALRELIVRESLSSPEASRLARVYRDYPVSPPHDREAAARALATLRGLAVANDPDSARRQTRALLHAVRAAAGGDTSGQAQLRQLKSLLAIPAFSQDRFARETSAAARSLAALVERSTSMTPEVRASLVDLRNTIDALLAKR